MRPLPAASTRPPRLVVLAGLPCAGKSTVAEGLSRALRAPVLSVDPIEAAMRRAGLPERATGLAAYAVAEALAEESLRLGLLVIVDAVNPVEAARAAWRDLGRRRNAVLTFVECVCFDEAVHRRRVDLRVRGFAGMPEVTWESVETRRTEYEGWAEERIVIDTSRETPERLVSRALAALGEGALEPDAGGTRPRLAG